MKARSNMSNRAMVIRWVVSSVVFVAVAMGANAKIAYAGPIITRQPIPQNVCMGGTAAFSITAMGAISYQWQKNQADLFNGGHYSGVG